MIVGYDTHYSRKSIADYSSYAQLKINTTLKISLHKCTVGTELNIEHNDINRVQHYMCAQAYLEQ